MLIDSNSNTLPYKVRRFLDDLLQNHITAIKPLMNRLTDSGYEYPELAQIIQPDKDDEKLRFLDEMVQSGAMKKKLHDVVHLCPECQHHDLNFREMCPHCRSLDIHIERVRDSSQSITIVDAGESDSMPQQKAMSKADSIREETNPENNTFIYRCLNCQNIFVESLVSCHCLNCDLVFDVSAARKKNIYIYTLNANFKNTVVNEALDLPLMEKILQDSNAEYYFYDDFVRKTNLEIRRCRKYQKKMTVMLIKLLNFVNLKDRLDKHAYSLLIRKTLLDILKSIQKPGTIGLKKNGQLLILFPGLHLSMAKIVGVKIYENLNNIGYELETEINLASYPQDGDNAEEVLEILELGLEKVNDNVFP